MFKWEEGRQQSGYEKMLLAQNPYLIPFDCYILRFKEGTEIAPHTDPVDDKAHHRINIIMKKAKVGGDFWCEEYTNILNRIFYFRPDKFEHSVSKITIGTRYVLSIGWIRNNE